MSTKSIARYSDPNDQVLQGDIFKNVKFNYIESEDDTEVHVIEYEFPLAVVISQACDIVAMEEILKNKKGKPTKFLPSILMCPIYEKNILKEGEHIREAYEALSLDYESQNLYDRKDYEVIKRDFHYRYHELDIEIGNKLVLENSILDFKHYFTVPMSYLIQHKKDRVFHLDELFAEQITLKFATFLSRVAIPDAEEKKSAEE